MTAGTAARRFIRATGVLCGVLAASGVVAQEQQRLSVTGELDVRWVDATGAPSFFDGGLGLLRFDPHHDGARLGHALLVSDLQLTDFLSAHVTADAYGDHDSRFAGISEAYLEAHPSPVGSIEWNAKVGAFFMPVSLENGGPGWTDVYTLTPSALNTWIGEEFRTIGTQLQARWIGANYGYPGDVSFTASAYAWNEPAGSLLQERGFALTDRPSNIFGSLGEPATSFYHELDTRPGYYAGLTWRHRDFLQVRALHYDNLANPQASNAADTIYAWHTRFTTGGVQLQPSDGLSFVAQYLHGDTTSGEPTDDQGPLFRMNYRAVFGLASFQWQRERLTARYDDFRTEQTSEVLAPPTDQRGHAWTVGFQHRLAKDWQLAAEWIHVSSSFPPRVEIGEADAIVESQFQVSVRYRFHTGL